MATFQVPQFIEEKPKIIGFLTLPQFLYLAAAGGLSFAAFYSFNFFLWLLITIALAAVALGLAFVKINGQSLPKMLAAALAYLSKPRMYTWQRAMEKAEFEVGDLQKMENLRNKITLQEQLKEIALRVTTSKLFSPKERRKQPSKENYQTITLMTGEKRLAKRADY